LLETEPAFSRRPASERGIPKDPQSEGQDESILRLFEIRARRQEVAARNGKRYIVLKPHFNALTEYVVVSNMKC
jgi:hypothetical protein